LTLPSYSSIHLIYLSGSRSSINIYDKFYLHKVYAQSTVDNLKQCVIPTCIGTTNNDIIIGSFLSERIFAKAGDDKIQGNGGADIVYGGDGSDSIQGGSAFDKLFGQDGDDYIYADATTNLVGSQTTDEAAINNRLNELLLGLDPNPSTISDADKMLIADGINQSGENPEIFSSTQSDLLLLQVSLLSGGAGNDHLFGASGNDVLVGGPGHDFFDCNEGIDRVLDYNANEDTLNANCEIL
jgi:Ca2+-binding RTX toxin-like protein